MKCQAHCRDSYTRTCHVLWPFSVAPKLASKFIFLLLKAPYFTVIGGFNETALEAVLCAEVNGAVLSTCSGAAVDPMPSGSADPNWNLEAVPSDCAAPDGSVDTTCDSADGGAKAACAQGPRCDWHAMFQPRFISIRM